MDVTVTFETTRFFGGIIDLQGENGQYIYDELEAKDFKDIVRMQAMDYGAQLCPVLADIEKIKLLKNPGQVSDFFLNGEFSIKVADPLEWFNSLGNEIQAKIKEERYDCASHQPVWQRHRVTFFDEEWKPPLSQELDPPPFI